MEDRQGDDEVELMVVGAAMEQVKAPLAKKRRLVKVADKGGAILSSFDRGSPIQPITPIFGFFSDDFGRKFQTKI